MQRKRYTEEQIIGFLKAHEAGAKLHLETFHTSATCRLGLGRCRGAYRAVSFG